MVVTFQGKYTIRFYGFGRPFVKNMVQGGLRIQLYMGWNKFI